MLVLRLRVVSRARSDLSLSKCFGPISGLHTRLFYKIQSNDFFLSWCTSVVFTAVTSASEVIFLQLVLLANATSFVHILFAKMAEVRKLARNGIASERSLTWFLLCFEMMAYKLAFHAYNAILDSLFYDYSATVDSFMTVSFFLRNLDSAKLSWLAS